MNIPIYFLSETGNRMVYSACNSDMSSPSDLAFFTMDLIQIRHFLCNVDHMVLQNLLMQLPYWTGTKAGKFNWKPFSDFSGFLHLSDECWGVRAWFLIPLFIGIQEAATTLLLLKAKKGSSWEAPLRILICTHIKDFVSNFQTVGRSLSYTALL